MNTLIAKLSCAAALSAALAVGCHQSEPAADKSAPAADAKKVPEVTVTDVASYVKDKTATIFDANDADTRHEYGVIPGAVLLASHKDYPLTQLPADKADKLVFYCGGTQCRASDAAAARAASAGYSNVAVMREGIRGWKSAGQPTSTPQT